MSSSSRGPGRPSAANRKSPQRAFSSRPQRAPSTYQTPSRKKLEAISYRPLKVIHAMPRVLFPLIMGALLLAGLLIPIIWAGLLLIVLGLLLAWLVALSWPAIEVPSRIIRIIVIVAVFGAAFWKLTGNG